MIDYEYYEDLYEPSHKNKLYADDYYGDRRYWEPNIRSWKKYRQTQYKVKKDKRTREPKNGEHWRYKHKPVTWYQWYYSPYGKAYRRKYMSPRIVAELKELLTDQLKTFVLCNGRYHDVAHALDGEAYIDGYWYTAEELINYGCVPRIYHRKIMEDFGEVFLPD